jgi:hypothetical protein
LAVVNFNFEAMSNFEYPPRKECDQELIELYAKIDIIKGNLKMSNGWQPSVAKRRYEHAELMELVKLGGLLKIAWAKKYPSSV